MVRNQIVSIMLLACSHLLAGWIVEGGDAMAEEPTKLSKTAPISASSGGEKVVAFWESPKLRSMEKAWLKWREVAATRPHSPYGFGMEHLAGLLKNELSQQELHALAASFETMPCDTRFQETLLDATIFICLEAGDRKGLVTLLAANCPLLVCGLYHIEYFIMDCGKKMDDKVVILGEAYSRARKPETRRAIATAVRRGFYGLGVRGRDDDELVKNAMQWYRENKDRVTFNGRYVLNAVSTGSDYRENPLFKMKPAS
jgi:hypothetical protein